MPRPKKYKSETVQVTFRIPRHIVNGLDNEAAQKNMPRAEIVLGMLIERYGDEPLKPARNVFG